jgi:hypothetical protein
MTIRVLDDAVYEECLDIAARHRGVTLEAAGKAIIRKLRDRGHAVWIRGVPGFVLRGFTLESSPGDCALVYITGCCPGAVIDRLDLRAEEENSCINMRNVRIPVKDAPIVIQNSTMQKARHAVLVSGRDREDMDRPVETGHVLIRNNDMLSCNSAVCLVGASYRVHVVGNRIMNSKWTSWAWEKTWKRMTR